MTARLPLFPLGTVLFPGLVLPLHIFEPRYRELVRNLLDLPDDQAREFGVVAIRRGWETEVGTPLAGTARAALTLHEVGCTAEIRQVTELPDGRFDLVTVGRRRFRIARVDAEALPYLVAEVEWLPEPPGQEEEADLLAPRVLAIFRQYLGLMRDSGSGTEPPASGEGGEWAGGEGPSGEQLPENPTVLSHLVAATAALTVGDRQRLLAAPDTPTRLRTELRLLAREAALLRQVRAVPVPLSELAVPPSPN
jgi:Lon protease-like protein